MNMETTTIEKIEGEINELKSTDRAELIRRLNQSQPKNGDPKKAVTNGKKGYVSPNTIWLRDHSAGYEGMHVAVKNGRFVAARPTLKELDLLLKEMDIERPLRTYIPRDGELFWGGW